MHQFIHQSCASRQPNKMIVIQYPRLKCNQTHSSAQCHPGCKEPVWSLHPGSPTNVQPITSYIFFSLFTPLFTCKPHHAPPRFKIIVGDQLRRHSELCRTSWPGSLHQPAASLHQHPWRCFMVSDLQGIGMVCISPIFVFYRNTPLWWQRFERLRPCLVPKNFAKFLRFPVTSNL